MAPVVKGTVVPPPRVMGDATAETLAPLRAREVEGAASGGVSEAIDEGAAAEALGVAPGVRANPATPPWIPATEFEGVELNETSEKPSGGGDGAKD